MIPVNATARLLQAIRNGDLVAVEALIAAGADVNAADGGQTPLGSAIEHMRVDIARRLIAVGADVNHDPGDGWTPLVHAIDIESDSAWQAHHEAGHETTDLTRMLLEGGALPTPEAFAIAERYGNLKAIALFRERVHQ